MQLQLPGIGEWMAAFFTLCIFSFLYRDNVLYRLAESIFAGVSFGYYIGLARLNTLEPNLFRPLFSDFAGHWPLLIPFALGLILYLRYVPKAAWISNWALAIYIGYYIGVNLIQRLHGEVLPQAKGTMLSLQVPPGQLLGNLVIILGVLTVLIYFFFSSPQRGPLKPAARIGVYYLMISFGASFGYTVMGRISLLIGRLTFVIHEWARPLVRAVFGG
ncbi:MAG: hypothetical protein FJY75_04345 [Candidatus Eisenbacteria bacterium]|uniref:Uncharacterized protein n=1 Tax=Eiseniibacteriota bacterium TaxID=2212470 RepID=A0A937XAJ6_UNCEI|nr:hypothetical protein [Candidatus Eisenbacteria bacterium]